MPPHSDAGIARLIREAARLVPTSNALDVARAPGLVALDVAESARHLAGLDRTPATQDTCSGRVKSSSAIRACRGAPPPQARF
jgi:hypothetical protein